MRRLLWLLLALLFLPQAIAAGEENDLFQWTLTLEGDGAILPGAIAPAADGAWIVGKTLDAGKAFGQAYGGMDAFVLRVDGQGNILWKHRYGGGGDDLFTHVVPTADGGCVAMGTTTSTDMDARASRGETDAFLVRLSAEGETLWTKCLGGTSQDELLDIVLTEDGRYFVCGRTQSRNGDLGSNQGGWDAWAALLSDDSGKPLWVMRYGQGGDDQFIRAMPSADGWMLLGELSESQGAANGETLYQSRPIAMLLSSEQEELWQVTLGGTGINQLRAAISTEAGWLFAGETNSSSVLMPTGRGGLDVWVLGLRQTGAMAWQRTYGGSADERVSLIRAVPAGGYALLGSTHSSDGQVQGAHGGDDLWFLRLGATGQLEWQQALGGSQYSAPAGFLLKADGGFLVAGTTVSQDGDIGPHPTQRAGFLAHLAVNGNLERLSVVGGEAECALLTLCAKDGVGYLLGSQLRKGGGAESLFLARLAEEGLSEY